MIDYFGVVLQIVSIIVLGVIIPLLLKSRNQAQWKEIYDKIVIAVNAVEQIYGGCLFGEDKKEKAIEYLRELGIDKTNEEIDIMVEAVVHEMNTWKDKLISK